MVICLVLNTLRILVDFNWENPYQRCIENSVKHLRLKLVTVQKMKFFIEDIFSKCEQLQFSADLDTFTEESLHGKLHFLCKTLFIFSKSVVLDA